MFFKDRYEASAKLAEIIDQQRLKGQWDVVGIARGGVVIAKEIAKLYKTKPKSICVEDILGKDFVFAASSLGSGILFTDYDANEWGQFIPDQTKTLRMPKLNEVFQAAKEKQERLTRNRPTQYGQQVILCDDGVVSGRTLFTAIKSLKHAGVKTVVAAIPVVFPWVLQNKFKVITWRVSKMTNPATGMFYNNFEDVPDEEVISILEKG
jgi:putative phosphoribosyl transferase